MAVNCKCRIVALIVWALCVPFASSNDTGEFLDKQSVNAEAAPMGNECRPMDCAEIYRANTESQSGLYQIWPRSRIIRGPISVFCDMDDDGGGWTVLQRRGDFGSPSDYFYKDWDCYKHGFGDKIKDFWIGNDNMHALTTQNSYTIKFDLSDFDGNTTYAMYNNFWIEDELHNYIVHFSGYSGTAGDSFTYHNNAPFTTKDRKNDQAEGGNCAVVFRGAWWHVYCHLSNLNGDYLAGPHDSFANGVIWYTFRGYYYSLKDAVMKIRPTNFISQQ